MSAHINLGLVFHQHQPVGNYDFVFEQLFRNSYEPLVACLERHPGVKVGLHYSGPLLDWLQVRRPEYIGRVRALVERGQAEILGGGYYEPALPAISESDRIGQMAKMRDEVARLFGRPPAGAWVAERVWEPTFPTAMADAGYRWTILDDVHFEGAGIKPEDLNSWYLTESEAKTIGVFGSNTRFRYLVPWGSVDDCVDFLRSAGDREPGSLVAMGDDGEKFGGWPTTFSHCWENGWVERFFERLERESHWIGSVHLSDWQAGRSPKSLVYLPTTSYREMGAWSLPPGEQRELERAKTILHEHGGDDLLHFLRGGHWRNFLVRYPEVNLLHKRSLLLSADAHAQQNAAALDHVWQAQCNCPFWHGVFGGLYLEHIRHANFGHLAAADAILRPGMVPPEMRDWDVDGTDEVCLRSAEHLAIVAPACGGLIEAWDLRGHGWNMTHVVARRPEAYHVGLGEGVGGEVRSIHDEVKVKDPEVLRRGFHYDRGMRLAAQDTFLEASAGRERHAAEREKLPPNVIRWMANGDSLEMHCATGAGDFEKTVRVGAELEVHYSTGEAQGRLCSEWNLSLPLDESGHPAIGENPGCLSVSSGWLNLRAKHNADEVWVEQIFSASNTEAGVELAPQGWSFVFAKDVGSRGQRDLSVRWSADS
jgi:4-alpha-glucanotransferase